ncbi:response regulator transcription factor [Streptomyces sp. NBC_00589]|uniref:response regulator transcription factor n=1 Tax=Streptomyces sp. NBC_00589 TaxID=2975785 RepID=UPI002E81F493|nr:response regulator transcription factor [Streptomyces sp. NBC_00589]WUB28692.1 response regulator transcription factor [Streptomyces sp. NBC_00589]
MIRIGIFGRHSVERAEVRQSVEQDDQVRVVSEGSIASASRLARTATPDILVLSHSNVDEALYTLRELDRLATTPKSIVLVDHVTEPGARRLLDRGANGILHSGDCVDNLRWAIRAAVAGSVALAPEVARPVVDRYLDPSRAAEEVNLAREQLRSLSPRCHEILSLLGDGLSNLAIAEKLSISTHTVKDHVRTIYETIGVENRVQAARIAWRAHSREPQHPTL